MSRGVTRSHILHLLHGSRQLVGDFFITITVFIIVECTGPVNVCAMCSVVGSNSVVLEDMGQLASLQDLVGIPTLYLMRLQGLHFSPVLQSVPMAPPSHHLSYNPQVNHLVLPLALHALGSNGVGPPLTLDCDKVQYIFVTPVCLPDVVKGGHPLAHSQPLVD